MSESLPKLRHVEAFPLQEGRKRLVALRDPTGIADSVVALSPHTFFLVQMFDGQHSVRDVQAAYVRQFGDLIRSDEIAQLAEQLDQALILDTPRFAEAYRQHLEAFRKAGVRTSSRTDAEARPGKLRASIERGTQDVKAPSPPEGAKAPTVGAIAPHIDFERGGKAYAEAYVTLREHCPADLFVILGTDHFGDAQFALTRNDFETPLGRVRTAQELVDAIAGSYAGDPFAGELIHRNEHSIECQVLWLQHLFADRDLEIVPILCGSFAELMEEGTSPSQSLEVVSLVTGLRDALAEFDRPTCVIASADLSHIGPHFGDDHRATPSRMAAAEKRDRAILDKALTLDPEGLFQVAAKDQNATNVCGLAAAYVTAAVLTEAVGQLIGYHSAPVPGSPSAVTFASGLFWSKL